MAKVALIKCDSYDYEQVKNAVTKGIDLLGGAAAFVKQNEKILLKPNWLAAESPEKAVTTHPIVFKAVAEVLLAQGAKLTYGDSPAFNHPETVAKKAGFWDYAEQLGIPLADFKTGKEVFFEKAVQNKKFVIANGVLDSEGVISLPKLKTHAFAKMTGCIKNQFGCIPGTLKGEFHVKLPDANDFSKMLVDLNAYIKPRLYIMDGIIAMEGNGPRGGKTKKMNILLFSADPVALDATVCRIIGLEPALVPTTKFGQEAGIGTYLESEIELLGDDINSFTDLKFDVKRNPIAPYSRGKSAGFIKNLIVPKPVIDASKCVKCGVCVKMCPVDPKVVDWHNGNKNSVPTYEYARCIRCYCCQELCPESAISLKTPFIRKLFSKSK